MMTEGNTRDARSNHTFDRIIVAAGAVLIALFAFGTVGALVTGPSNTNTRDTKTGTRTR